MLETNILNLGIHDFLLKKVSQGINFREVVEARNTIWHLANSGLQSFGCCLRSLQLLVIQVLVMVFVSTDFSNNILLIVANELPDGWFGSARNV